MFSGDGGALNQSSAFMYHNYENITLIASGMGDGVRDNFIIIEVNDNKIHFNLIALNVNDINSLGHLTDYELP